jgi:Flp pilus assembly protein protease CpaA
MFQIAFLVIICLLWVLFAVVQDLRKREIANWLNFSLIIFALAFRFCYGLFFDIDFTFFYQGLIGLGIFFVLGNLFYYGHIFAGGDAKLMIAFGAILPFSKSFLINVRLFVLFFMLFLIVGMIYGLIFSFVLMIKNWKSFKREFINQLSKFKKRIFYVLLIGLIFMGLGFFEPISFCLGIFIFGLPYVFIFSKAIDEACMVKKIKTSLLTEGDWLYKDVLINDKKVKARWEGVSKEDIKLLQKHKEVIIKQGIAFAPVFLISFILLVVLFYLGALDFFDLLLFI